MYLVTRVHGLSTRLIKRDAYEHLIKLPSLDALVEAIGRGDYADKISSILGAKVNARILNRVFSEKYIERLTYIIKISGKKLRKFLLTFVKRLEVENIRRVVRSKFHGLELKLDDLLPIPRAYTSINFPAMVDAKTLDEALSLLGFTNYKNVVNKVPISREVSSTIPMEAFLDSIHFHELMDAIKGVPDEDVVRAVLGTEVDLKNIYYVISFKLLNVPTKIIEESIIKPLYRLRVEEVNELIRAREDMLLDALSRTWYGSVGARLAKLIESRSIEGCEYEVSKAFKEYLDRIAVTNALGMGYVMWYLYNIEYEYRSLSAIAFGKELGLDVSLIKVY